MGDLNKYNNIYKVFAVCFRLLSTNCPNDNDKLISGQTKQSFLPESFSPSFSRTYLVSRHLGGIFMTDWSWFSSVIPSQKSRAVGRFENLGVRSGWVGESSNSKPFEGEVFTSISPEIWVGGKIPSPHVRFRRPWKVITPRFQWTKITFVLKSLVRGLEQGLLNKSLVRVSADGIWFAFYNWHPLCVFWQVLLILLIISRAFQKKVADVRRCWLKV